MTPTEVSLLIAMMSTSAAILSIGFATYAFLWNLVYRWRREMKDWWEEHKGKDEASSEWVPDPEDKNELKTYIFLFIGLLLDGGLAFGTIVIGAVTIALDIPGLIVVVSILYALALLTFLILFANQIARSIKKMRKDLGRGP